MLLKTCFFLGAGNWQLVLVADYVFYVCLGLLLLLLLLSPRVRESGWRTLLRTNKSKARTVLSGEGRIAGYVTPDLSYD